jgi:hypothetical protein
VTANTRMFMISYRTSNSAAAVLVTPTVYSFVSFIYLMTFLAAQYCIGVTGSVYFHDITLVHGAAAPFFYKVQYMILSHRANVTIYAMIACKYTEF